jgi:hypothetical protein
LWRCEKSSRFNSPAAKGYRIAASSPLAVQSRAEQLLKASAASAP